LTNHHDNPPATVPATETTSLARDLAAARLQSANRLAAIRAALSAAADGEPDPLAYLRDQIAEEAASKSGL
jgi:hypothetical protein